MKEKTRSKDDKYNVEATSADDLDGCGTTEATGLIPSLPQSREQLDSYTSILQSAAGIRHRFLFLRTASQRTPLINPDSALRYKAPF